MKDIKSNLGTMHYEIIEDRFKLYDSDQEYIGYIDLASGNFNEEDIPLLIEDLEQIEHISKIVDLGFCGNMIFCHSKKEVINYLLTFQDEDYVSAEDYEDLDIINRVGNNYILVDFDDFI